MINLKSLDIYTLDINSCVDEVILEAKTSRNCKMLSCINPHSFVVAKKDNFFADSLKNTKWLIPDGIGIVIASKLYSKQIKNRLTGPDFYDQALEKLNKDGGTIAYLGSTDENLNKIKCQITKKYKNIEILTMISPPFLSSFKGDVNEDMLEEINRCSPDILWVGMTAPKQEKWIFENQKRLNVGVAAAVGAVFDFSAGKITRAPKWMQKYHLEWLHRFLKNPVRLASRTFISAPLFICHVLYEKYFV